MAKDMYQKRKERQENKKNGTYEDNKTNINWYPGHMAKTKRLIKEKYDLIDIVYELVDARIPKSSKIKDIDDLIKNKPKLLIMTKYDLCDMTETNKWIKYYENLGYKVITTNLNDLNSYKLIVNVTHEMMEPMQEKRMAKGLSKKEIKALVIGIPNVGKSTLINRLAKRKAANVGNMPGITKSLDWLKTDSDILLLDSPGILWPKLDNDNIALNLASMTAIKEEIIPKDEVAVYILNMYQKYYPNVLKMRYNLDDIDDIMASYETIAKKTGAMLRGGEVDDERVSTSIINDLKNEIIKGVTFDRYEV